MIAFDRFSHFRLALTSLYERERHQRHGQTTLNLFPLLAIPVLERLVLLAKIDGAKSSAITSAIRVTPADASLTSERMIEAVRGLREHLADPYDFIEMELVDYPSSRFVHHHGDRIERRFLQWLFADVGVCLFGEGMPPQLLALSLKDRLILYLLIVEQLERREVQEVVRCSEHAIKMAIRRLEAVLATLPVVRATQARQYTTKSTSRPHHVSLHS